MNQTTLSVINVINIFLLVFSTFNLFKRKHIIKLLLAFSVLSLALLELAKFSLVLDFVNKDVIFGLGFCLLPLFWLTLSISFIPAKKDFLNRMVLLPLLGFTSMVFMVIWWIKPFLYITGYASLAILPPLAKIFFIFLIVSLSLTLANMEKSILFLKQKRLWLLMAASVFMLGPYIILAAHAVLFSAININILNYSSLSVLFGGIIFLFATSAGFSIEKIKEDTAVNSSLVLFLIGGYLFFIGAFIKLFQMFGWNMKTLFSFLTSFFIAFVLLFIVMASSLKERIKNFLFKNMTRQKYDWQRIWEDFTFKISSITDVEEIKKTIKEAVSRIMNVYGVDVFVFDKDVPFELEFCDWMLRRAEPFSVYDTFSNTLFGKFPKAEQFLSDNRIELVTPLYGNRAIVGLIGLRLDSSATIDKELLKVLALQASGVIINCRAYQSLREAEKKESIYKLSSFIIHDLKNFINGLSLLSSNKDKFSNPQFQKDALFTLDSTISKMNDLIDEFRSLKGDLTIVKKECNLKDVITQAIKDIGQDRLQEIKLNYSQEDIFVMADADYLHKVVFNILLNSLEAMNHKGEISIKGEQSNGFMYLSIKDTGCGMSQEFIKDSLFKPFTSTKEKGLGIGLFQSKAIIEAHGGTVSAESTVNEGTTFTIKIPVK